MFKLSNSKVSAALLTAVTMAVACATVPAQATPVLQIKLQSGASTYTSTPAVSPLVVVQSIGNFSTTVNTGTATANPALDLSSVEINSSAGGTLVITLSASGFTTPFGAADWATQFSGNFVTGSATVTLQTYLDNTDTLLGTGTALSTLIDTATPFGFRDVKSASTDGSFALTEILTITTTGAALVSLDASIAYVPEPASVALLGAAMISTGVVSRRRRKVA